MSYKHDENETKKIVKRIIIGVVSLIIFITLLCSFTTIRSGEIGVKSKFGEITGQTTAEGIVFKIPYIEKITKVNMKVQKAEIDSTAATKDLQDVSMRFAINYRLNPENVVELYKKVGANYAEIILNPAVQEALKNATSAYTAEELVTRRSEVSKQIIEDLNAKVEKYGIVISELNIINLNFSEAYNNAIEAKQIAEQEVKKAQQELEKTKVEAEKKITEAKAEAESLKLQKQEITDQLLELRRIEAQLKAIEKWDGKTPSTVIGDSIPFINIK